MNIFNSHFDNSISFRNTLYSYDNEKERVVIKPDGSSDYCEKYTYMYVQCKYIHICIRILNNGNICVVYDNNRLKLTFKMSKFRRMCSSISEILLFSFWLFILFGMKCLISVTSTLQVLNNAKTKITTIK